MTRWALVLLLLLLGCGPSADPRERIDWPTRPSQTFGVAELYYDPRIPRSDYPRLDQAYWEHYYAVLTRCWILPPHPPTKVYVVAKGVISMRGWEPRVGVRGNGRPGPPPQIYVVAYDEHGLPTIPDLTHQLLHAWRDWRDPDAWHSDPLWPHWLNVQDQVVSDLQLRWRP